jgi:hypothetical protein
MSSKFLNPQLQAEINWIFEVTTLSGSDMQSI